MLAGSDGARSPMLDANDPSYAWDLAALVGLGSIELPGSTFRRLMCKPRRPDPGRPREGIEAFVGAGDP